MAFEIASELVVPSTPGQKVLYSRDPNHKWSSKPGLFSTSCLSENAYATLTALLLTYEPLVSAIERTQEKAQPLQESLTMSGNGVPEDGVRTALDLLCKEIVASCGDQKWGTQGLLVADEFGTPLPEFMISTFSKCLKINEVKGPFYVVVKDGHEEILDLVSVPKLSIDDRSLGHAHETRIKMAGQIMNFTDEEKETLPEPFAKSSKLAGQSTTMSLAGIRDALEMEQKCDMEDWIDEEAEGGVRVITEAQSDQGNHPHASEQP